MKPVDQEFLHIPGEQYGDCQRAVIASLLELPISEVPHFLKEVGGDSYKYWRAMQEFVGKHGYAWLTMPARCGATMYGLHYERVYHEIAGPSPRGNGAYHAVVGCNGQIVFDPHPSREGLAGDSKDWSYSYLVRFDKPIQEGE